MALIIIILVIFITSAALSKIRRAAGTCHSVLTKRCAYRRCSKVAVDSVDRRSSAGKLFQVSGPETAKFLRPMAVAVRCTSSFPEAADRRCRRPARWTTGRQSSATYGGARYVFVLGRLYLSRRCDVCYSTMNDETATVVLMKLSGYTRTGCYKKLPSFTTSC